MSESSLITPTNTSIAEPESETWSAEIYLDMILGRSIYAATVIQFDSKSEPPKERNFEVSFR